MYSEDLVNDGQIFIPIGCYKGNTVAMKKILVPINLTRPLMVELKAMKDIQHDHLVRFYGAVIDSVPCMLTEYCSKGSLQDILENHEINLDWMFKLSLMHDIVKVIAELNFPKFHTKRRVFPGHALSSYDVYSNARAAEVIKLCRRLAICSQNN